MELIHGEPEEPPSCHTATTLLTKPHRRINSTLPVTAPGFGALTARLERFPVGPATRAFRKRYFPEAELAEPRGFVRAAATNPHSRGHRISEDAGRGRRSARRGWPHRSARPRASLSGSRPVPRHRFLLDLLPLLHALAHGRRARRGIFLQPAAMGGGARLHRVAS